MSSALSIALRSRLAASPLTVVLAAVALVTLVRAAAVVATPLNLGPDEAQYWSWSLTPAFGYFSKPPLIAWLIGASTAICGDGEACIRISSPLLHGATSLVLFFAGRTLYDARVGLWAALTYLLMPGTSFSALLITTDVPLLFFWSLALLALAKLRSEPGMRWAVVLGAAMGLGLLTKYAMLYFIGGAVLAAMLGAKGRAFLLSRQALIAALVALAVFSPNIAWNITHHFATVGHTAANANWNAASLFNPGKALEFLAAQIGIIGPVAAGLLIWGAARGWRDRNIAGPDTLLLALSVPVVAIVAVQAFISRANANWAATAFVALAVLAAAWAVRNGRSRFLLVNLVVNAAAAVLIVALAVSPAIVTALGQDNAAKRLRGWGEAGRTIAAASDAAAFTAIVSDDREDMASLYYYARPRKLPLRMWPKADAGNEYEAVHALKADEAANVLFVTRREDPADVLKAFARVERIATLSTRLDAKRTRKFFLFALSGPLSRDLNPQN